MSLLMVQRFTAWSRCSNHQDEWKPSGCNEHNFWRQRFELTLADFGTPTYSRWTQPRRNALDKELRWVKEYPLLPLRFVFSSGVSGLKVLRIHHMFRIQRSKQRHLKDLDSSCQVRTRYRLLTASIFAGG